MLDHALIGQENLAVASWLAPRDCGPARGRTRHHCAMQWGTRDQAQGHPPHDRWDAETESGPAHPTGLETRARRRLRSGHPRILARAGQRICLGIRSRGSATRRICLVSAAKCFLLLLHKITVWGCIFLLLPPLLVRLSHK